MLRMTERERERERETDRQTDRQTDGEIVKGKDKKVCVRGVEKEIERKGRES